MIDKDIFNKIKGFWKFAFSGFTASILLGAGSIVLLIAIAIFGSKISGAWFVGDSFDTWWQTISKTPTINSLYSATDPSVCWSCNIFIKLMDLLTVVGLEVYTYLADICFVLMVTGFAVWLLNYMYKNIILSQNGDVGGMVKDIAKKIIVISILSVALFSVNNTAKTEKDSYLTNMATTIFENTAVPLFKLGLGVSSKILDIKVDNNSGFCEKLYFPEEGNSKNLLITHEMKKDLLCLMNSVNIVFLSAMKAGANMVSLAFKEFFELSLDFKRKGILLGDIVAGMLIIVVFFMMYIWVPFSLIDIVFTIGLLISFIPIMVLSYAYDEVSRLKSFTKKALGSLWHIVWYLIVYAIFLGILYSSFVYIADKYYPGPLDNFTFLFPDFVYSFVTGKQPDSALTAAFKSCVTTYGTNLDSLQKCLLSYGINFEAPSFTNPGGSFLPMFSFGIISLMLMFGSISTYAGIIGGSMLSIGNAAKNLFKSSLNFVKTNVTKGIRGFVAKKQKDSFYKGQLKKQQDNFVKDILKK